MMTNPDQDRISVSDDRKIKLDNPRIHEERIVRLDVHNLDSWPAQWSKSGKFRPSVLTIQYNRSSFGSDFGFDYWCFTVCILSGPRIKSDGSDSVQDGQWVYSKSAPDIPDWLEHYINFYHPDHDEVTAGNYEDGP